MNTLFTLVKMQLHEKISFKRIEISKNSAFNFIINVLLTFLKFAFVVALCYVFIMVAKMFSLFSLIDIVPQSVMSFIFIVMLLASTFSCTIGLTKSLYYSKDNAVLLTLPATPMQIFLSKIIIFYIFELKRSFSFLVPLFLSYFFLHGYEPVYYFWMLLSFLFITMFTVALSAFLSIPGMWIGNIFNQYKLLQNTCMVLVGGAIVWAVVYVISLIPTNIAFYDQISIIKIQLQTFFKGYAYYNPTATASERLLKPVYNLTLLILGGDNFAAFNLGQSMIRLLILVGAILCLAFISVFIVKPLFYKMASTPFEYKKKPVKTKKNILFNKKLASFIHEMRVAIKSPDRMYSNVLTAISIPVLIMLLNKVFAAMNVAQLGEFMIVTFNVLIILLIALNSNVYAASIYSKDGRSSYLIKTQPTDPIWLILAKLMPNTIFVTISLITTAFVTKSLTTLSTIDVVFLFFGIFFIYLTHLFLCAESDIMNPQIEIYATIGNNESNPNEIKATAFAFGASFVIAIIVMLLLMARENHSVYFRLALVSLVALCWKVYIFISKVKLYYKEK